VGFKNQRDEHERDLAVKRQKSDEEAAQARKDEVKAREREVKAAVKDQEWRRKMEAY
jgi:hypothetical protein